MNRLNELAEEFLSSSATGRQGRFRDLTSALKRGIEQDRCDEVADVLRRVGLPTLDITSAQSLYRICARLRERASLSGEPTRLAILGGFTTDLLTELVELYLFAGGVAAEVYQADYGVFRQEILDPSSRLYAFQPRFTFLAATWHELGHHPDPHDGPEEVERLVAAELADWAMLWNEVHRRSGCQVIQDNFVAPPWRVLGNLEMRHPSSFGRFVARINESLMAQAPEYVTIHDVEHLAASVGRRSWADERFYHQAKLPCAPEHLVDYAHQLASVVAAHLGLAKKCLVLDLDNTLWGGIVGEDGLEGIRIGPGDPEGEAYQAFQRYVKALRTRGVILAVCSANEERTAREVFDRHPEMVLRLEDISCLVANWGDKATNVRRIASELNIGLNSLVFVDDDPSQRSLVRQLVPEVAVPELSDDPSDLIATLERYRYFQVVSVGKEDLERTELYRANLERGRSSDAAGSLEEFLVGLEMETRTVPIHPGNLVRSAQLINKTNQFNLTTRRYSPADVQSMAESSDWITRTVTLADRFGDNGLISVVLAREDGHDLVIDTWVMSCRVLRRGVEDLLMEHLFVLAGARGLKRIRGEYLPTAKNGLVFDHYARLGFTRIEDSGPASHWELDLDAEWKPRATFMREVEVDG